VSEDQIKEWVGELMDEDQVRECVRWGFRRSGPCVVRMRPMWGTMKRPER